MTVCLKTFHLTYRTFLRSRAHHRQSKIVLTQLTSPATTATTTAFQQSRFQFTSSAVRLLRIQDKVAHQKKMAHSAPDYSSWPPEKLVQRIAELEKALNEASVSADKNKFSGQKGKPFDPTKYNTRFIALKFAYLGKRFNGFEHSGNTITPYPTIEEELWKALMRTRLIFPRKKLPDSDNGEENENTESEYDLEVPAHNARLGQINWEGCNYSKCGRTDKGVSSFGQVIGIQVRSSKPMVPKEEDNTTFQGNEDTSTAKSSELQTSVQKGKAPKPGKKPKSLEDWDPIVDEIPYVHILNQALPPEIRVLAWCPSPPPDFSARFSCRERQYKYFFTNPALLPVPNELGCRTGADGQKMREGWLNLEKMKEAASYFIGKHDFRNFSKVDPVRQMTDFTREVFYVGIEEISDLNTPSFLAAPELGPLEKLEGSTRPKLYAFCVNGSAFLYHQVRHMVGMLFMVGQGLEEPSIVKELLDVGKNPRKPNYEMASDVPLVLWDCIFPSENSGSREDALEWVYPDTRSNGITSRSGPVNGKWGQLGLMESLWSNWRTTKMEETLAGLLMDTVARQGMGLQGSTPQFEASVSDERRLKVFDGGDSTKSKGKHVPVMQRDLLDPVEVINARWAAKKAEKKEQRKRSSDQMEP